MAGAVAGLIGSLKAAVVAALTKKYFIATVTAPSVYTLNAVVADSLGNSYWSSNNYDSASNARTGVLLIKKAVDGSVVWAKNIGTYATATNYEGDAINGMRIVGSTLWVWGALHENLGVTGYPWVAKYDLDGNLINQYSTASNFAATLFKGEVDSSGYFHAFINYYGGKGVSCYEVIYSPTLGNVSNNNKYISACYPACIVSRPTDNAVFRAFYDDSNSWYGVDISAAGAPSATDSSYKFNTTDSAHPLQYGFSVGLGAKVIDFDSSGNLYVLFTEYPGFSSTVIAGGMILAKFNTSMVLQWSRRIQTTGAAGNIITGYTMRVDKTNNFIYILGTESNQPHLILAKYNTSGTIQWKNKIRLLSGGTDMYLYPSDMDIDSNGDALLSIRTTVAFGLKVKADGSQATGSTLTLSGTSPVYTSIISTATNTEAAYASTISAAAAGYNSRTTASVAPLYGTGAGAQYTPTITNIVSTYTERAYTTT